MTLATVRPGRGALVGLIGGLLVVALIVVAGPLLSSARQDWDQGTPGVFEVAGVEAAGWTPIRGVSDGQDWLINARQVDRLPGGGIPGTRFMGRIGGECDCRVMLKEPPGLPRGGALLGLLMAAGALPGLFARSRWRQLGSVLSSPGRSATHSAAWLGGRLGPARLGVVTRTEGHPDLYLELEGTLATWFLDDQMAVVHGPHRSNGLTAVTNSEGKTAVASSAALLNDRGARRVTPWSDELVRLIGLAPEVAALQQMGGDQRIRVTPAADSISLCLNPKVAARRIRLLLGLMTVVMLALIFFVYPNLDVLVPTYAGFFVLFRLIPRWPKTGGSRRPPFAGWENREAARGAAAAANRAGFIPIPAARTGS